MELKVVTYNIHKGFSPGNLRFVLHGIRDALVQIAPDLIFLQEVQGEHKRQRKKKSRWPEGSQFEFIADALWPHYAYAKNAVYQAGHHGNAILSKYPISAWENINVSQIGTASRSLLHANIEIPGFDTPLHAICIHLGLFKTERASQLSQLNHRIAAHTPSDEPIIIGGDFNEWRGKALDNFERDLHLTEVFKSQTGHYARTFPAIRPALRMDRIYFRGLDLQTGQRLDKKPWRLLSDHLPLLATFKIN